MKRAVLGVLSVLLLFGISGCGSTKEEGKVRYWNSKPEVAEVWEEIADVYEAETGVKVEIINPPTNSSNATLLAAMGKKNPPTLFKVSGQSQISTWGPYCRDLSDTNLYSWVLDKEMVLKGEDGKSAAAIPYVVEGYGIIYNDAIMKKYFSMGTKTTPYNSMDEVNSFAKLKEVADDMQAHKADLGIKGVFASTSFAGGEEWRWQSHLWNMPVYGEFTDKNVIDEEVFDFTYADNFKQIFDLYLTDSTCDSKEVGSKTVTDSMTEFAKGECAMVQNGNWAWGQISETEGNVVEAENCKYLPIYCGLNGEETQGLCIGTENYIAVNNLASEADQKASIDFLEWLYSSDKGKDFVTNKLQFITVFSTFDASEAPSNPLAVEVATYLNDTSKSSVSWDFLAIPSQEYKDGVANHLYDYIMGKRDWNSVVDYAKAEWQKEKTGE